ncbi:MAG: 50S ribosomal protein L18Ae [Candidatus Hodarchaeota archaeon]
MNYKSKLSTLGGVIYNTPTSPLTEELKKRAKKSLSPWICFYGYNRGAENLQAQIFRISGTYKGKRGPVEFSKEVRALQEEDAIELLHTDLGSKHRIRRGAISVTKVEVIKSIEEVKDPVILRLVLEENIGLMKE